MGRKDDRLFARGDISYREYAERVFAEQTEGTDGCRECGSNEPPALWEERLVCAECGAPI